MCVLSHVERPIDALRMSILTNRLRDCEDMRFGKCSLQRRATMPARAEADELVCVGYVRPACVILALHLRDVDQQVFRGGFACKWRDRHVHQPSRCRVSSQRRITGSDLSCSYPIALRLAVLRMSNRPPAGSSPSHRAASTRRMWLL